MLFFIVLGILMLLPGLFFTALAIRSLNPNNLISTTGELSRKIDFKNYKLRNRSVPNAVEYIYTYTSTVSGIISEECNIRIHEISINASKLYIYAVFQIVHMRNIFLEYKNG